MANNSQECSQEISSHIDSTSLDIANKNIKIQFLKDKIDTREENFQQNEKLRFNSGRPTQVNVTSHTCREEEYSSSSILNMQQSTSENKTSYLTLINEIFERFEAAMRGAQISTDLVCCLINLHQNTTDVCFTCGQVGPTLEVLYDHINALQASFTKFAYSCKTFQDMLEIDKTELLKRNALMFVMVCI